MWPWLQGFPVRQNFRPLALASACDTISSAISILLRSGRLGLSEAFAVLRTPAFYSKITRLRQSPPRKTLRPLVEIGVELFFRFLVAERLQRLRRRRRDLRRGGRRGRDRPLGSGIVGRFRIDLFGRLLARDCHSGQFLYPLRLRHFGQAKRAGSVLGYLMQKDVGVVAVHFHDVADKFVAVGPVGAERLNRGPKVLIAERRRPTGSYGLYVAQEQLIVSPAIDISVIALWIDARCGRRIVAFLLGQALKHRPSVGQLALKTLRFFL